MKTIIFISTILAFLCGCSKKSLGYRVPSLKESKLSYKWSGSLVDQVFNEQVEGDYKFLYKLDRFRSKLYRNRTRLDEKLENVLSERRIPKSSNVIGKSVVWMPIECKLLDIRFRKREEIHNEGPDDNAVYRVEDTKIKSKMYAYKLFGDSEEYASEISFFMMADHPNIVKPICIKQDPKSKRSGLLLEFIKGETSRNFAENCKDPNKLREMANELWDTLKYIHDLGFIHGDLKAENVMVEKYTNKVIVIDFGFALPFPHEHPGRGNPSIKAPELTPLVEGPLHEALDNYAFGSIIAHWFAYLYPEFNDKRKYKMLKIGHKKMYKFGYPPTRLPKSVRALLYYLTDPDPDRRRFNTPKQRKFIKSLAFFHREL